MTTRLEQIKARLEKHGGCTNSDLAALLRIAEAADRWEEAKTWGHFVATCERDLLAAVRAFREGGEEG